MSRLRRVWRRVVTEARRLRDRYWASELDPFFQGPDEDEPAEHSVRVDPDEVVLAEALRIVRTEADRMGAS